MLNEHKLSYQEWLNNNKQLLSEQKTVTELEELYEEYLSGFDAPDTD
jgi:hypothetical protein